MSSTPILSLPYIQPAQAQKHITHNEALRLLDALVQLAVLGRGSSEPPFGAQDGDCHIVGVGGSGDWSGRDGDIAVRSDGQWSFITPLEGWQAYDIDAGEAVVFKAGTWGAGQISFENLQGIGIGGSSDANNRLSVVSEATLLSHDGGGHLLKLNKASQENTASLLFQSNFSGHAEMGLVQSNDFAIKVSADGNTFLDALRVDSTTGVPLAPQGFEINGALKGTAVQAHPFDVQLGQVLTTGAFGLGIFGHDNGALQDAEQSLRTGFYEGGGGSVPKDSYPDGSARFGPVLNLVRSRGPNHVRIFFSGDRPICRRSDDDCATWEDANFMYGTRDILAPVAQEDGVPTGGIVEQGSNGDGHFVRFADGTQICTRTVSANGLVVTSGQGTLFSTVAESYNFAMPFDSLSHVSGSFVSSEDVALHEGVFAIRHQQGESVTQWRNVSLVSWASASAEAGDATVFTLFAIGRWF